jgi:hypothetical protein
MIYLSESNCGSICDAMDWHSFHNSSIPVAHRIIESLPRASATLVLRWAEVVVICLISVILQAGIHFRREILNSWLIADWAAHKWPTGSVAAKNYSSVLYARLTPEMWSRSAEGGIGFVPVAKIRNTMPIRDHPTAG